MTGGKHACRPDPRYRNVADMLRLQAEEYPSQWACTILGRGGQELDTATYGELDRRVRSVAATLQTMTAPGQRVLLMYPTGVDFVVSFFACAYAGLAAVPVPCPEGPGAARAFERLQGIVKDADPALIMTTAEVAGHPDLELLTSGRRVLVDQGREDRSAAFRAPVLDLDAPVFLQYTSGSTSEPKGAVITHRNVLANLAAVATAVRMHECPPRSFRVVSWLPLFHDMGLGQLLATVYAGGSAAFMAPMVFLLRPVEWLQAIDRYRAHLSSAPNFGYDFCVDRVTAEELAGLDLSSWRVALNGSEPVRPESLERFAEAFRPARFDPEAFMPSYGMAESTLYVSGARSPGDVRVVDVDVEQLERHGRIADPAQGAPARRVVACGRVPENLDVRVVDPETGRQCEPDVAGEIWVRGDSMAAGYWQRPDATRERFGAALDGAGEAPFVRTRDLGFLRHGQVFVLGRLDDVIIVDGRNHYPSDIESTVQGCHPALSPNRSAAFAYQDGGRTLLGIVAETARRARIASGEGEGEGTPVAEITAAVRRAVADEHQLRAATVVLLRPGALPVTTSGKIRRGRCRELFLQNGLTSW
ncbi:fatty acyl-AMP ligase [Micromonospora sp. B11E3]|uniref:fatty acyl-AMP ligase n=1 Tax=Micromonospora sp. B11E3 TaxID=3153562 RepID=UPI00325CBCA9